MEQLQSFHCSDSSRENDCLPRASRSSQRFGVGVPNPDASSDQNFFLNGIIRKSAKKIGTAVFENQLNRFNEILPRFIDRFTLAIGTGNLRTDSPKTAIWRGFNDRSEFRSHALKIQQRLIRGDFLFPMFVCSNGNNSKAYGSSEVTTRSFYCLHSILI